MVKHKSTEISSHKGMNYLPLYFININIDKVVSNEVFYLLLIFIFIVYVTYHFLRQISSVAIALGYGLDDRDSRVRFPAGAENFSFHHRVQNGSGTHPTSNPIGTRGFFPGNKATEA
jgi:hypothetical protein